MRSFYAKSDSPIYLGRAGENLATQVIFNISSLIEMFGVGTVSLIAKREGDTAPYPCIIERSGNKVTWKVTNADNAKEGKGSCELRYMVGDTIVKSETWETVVWESLGTPREEAPEPYQDWIDQILDAEKRVLAAEKQILDVAEKLDKEIVDVITGKIYTLQIANGKLTMSEVTV